MVLSRLTKITGPGVSTDTNWVGNNADFTGITTSGTSFNIGVTTIHSNLIEAHNIKSTGIITATGGSFSGNVTAVDGTFSGNVSIAGTLTYEDVTNIDSVGIVTALGFKTIGVSTDAGVTNGFTAGRISIYDNNSHNIFRIGTYPSYAPAVFNSSNIVFSTNGFYVRNTAATRNYIGINNSTGILQLGYGAATNHGYKLETSAKGIKVGTGVTIETNGQAEVAGITTFYKDVHIKSGTNRLYLGTTDRLSLIADPSHSYLRNSGSSSHFQIHSNNFSVRSYDGNGSITLFYSPVSDGNEGGGPRLYHNHGAGLILERLRTTKSGVNIVGTTTSTQLAVTGVSTFSDNLNIIDDKKIIVGNGDGQGNDLEIFHQSSNNYNYIKSPAKGLIILNSGNNATYIKANYFNLHNASSTVTYATANGNQINLRYASSVKLQTTGYGVTITSQLDTTNLSVSGVSTFTGRSDHSSSLQMLAGNNIVLQNDSNSANCQIDCYGGAGFRLTSYNQTMFTCENGSNTKFYTDSGTSRLEITHAGDVLVNTGGLHIPDALTHIGDTDTKIRFPAADTITAETGGNERFRIDSSGRIGINETSPSAELDVKGDGVPVNINSSNSNTFKIAFEDNGTVRGYLGSDNTNLLNVGNSSAASQFTINTAGVAYNGNTSTHGSGVFMCEIHTDILRLLKASQNHPNTTGNYYSWADGGTASWSWDHYGMRMDANVGSHNWQCGSVYLTPGTYTLMQCWKAEPNTHGWSVFGSNSNGNGYYLTDDQAYGSYNTLLTSYASQSPSNDGRAFWYGTTSGNFFHNVTSAGTYRIQQMGQPYGSGGYKYYILAAYLLKLK